MKKVLLSALTMVLVIAALAGVAMAERPGFLGSPAEAAVPGPIGSKDCIAYCELYGIISYFGVSKAEHAQFHTPQTSMPGGPCPYIWLVPPPQPQP